MALLSRFSLNFPPATFRQPPANAQATTAPATTAPAATSDEDTDSGIPAWVWIIVAVAVVAIAVVVILLRRGGNKGNTAPNVPGGFTPDGRTPYGAPANPAQGGVPYAQPNQFQQPGQPPQQFGQQPGEPTQG